MSNPTASQPAEITVEEMSRYTETTNAFEFELKVFRLCQQYCSRANHGEVYPDPVLGKDRQFDIRATRWEPGFAYNLAVECKTIAPTNALLVNRVPDRNSDRFNDVMIVTYSKLAGRTRKEVLRMNSFEVFPSTFVGKALEYVHLKGSGRVLEPGRETEIYDRWSQAIASAEDWMISSQAKYELANPNGFVSAMLFIPVLVIPDGSLWAINHDPTANAPAKPERVEIADLFLNKTVSEANFTFSRLHIFTISGFEKFLKGFKAGYFVSDFFEKEVRDRVAHLQGSVNSH